LARTSAFASKRAIITRATKQKGKRKKKEKPEPPPGFRGVEQIAEDWGKWKHGQKIDVTYPFKPGEEPQWVIDLIKSPHLGSIKKIADLDPYKQGYKFVTKRIRREKIKEDNKWRAWREWSLVPSLRRGNSRRKHPTRIAP